MKRFVRVLKGDFLTQGPAVAEFEKSVTDFLTGLTTQKLPVHALAVNNGTTALHLACLALGVKTGDKVLVTGNSFAASANCVLYCGADVEFVDINLDDFCLDFAALETKLKSSSPGTYKGVIVVDFAGHLVDLEKLRGVADAHKLWIIEDACHAIGATRKNSKGEVYAAADGRYADISVFSFHPVKHIATGEGGMILTGSNSLFEKLKPLRTHGITKDPAQMTKVDGGWYHEMQTLGYNGRISDILCALGTSQMKRIDSNLARRREIATRYSQELKSLPIKLPVFNDIPFHAFHLYVIRTENRKELYDFLFTKKIFPQVHYLPIYQHPFYIGKYGKQSKTNCDEYYRTCLSIPMYHGMTNDEQTRVIEAIREFYQTRS